MRKFSHFLMYQLLIIKSKIKKIPLQYLGKDYFIYWADVIKIDWLRFVHCFSYRETIKHLTWHKFHINWETIIDIENWIKVLFHWVKLLPNVAWYIINNKQYNAKLELIDEWELYRVFFNFIITTYKQNWWTMYKIMNLNWEELYTMFSEWEQLNIKASENSDFATFTIGNHSKELHVSWIKGIIL